MADCIVMPPPPPAPSPAPTPAPVPPPGPAPAPGNPPGPPPNALVIDTALSKVFSANGLNQTFNQVMSQGGFGNSSGAYTAQRIELVVRNVTQTTQSGGLSVYSTIAGIDTNPASWPQSFSIVASQAWTATIYLTLSGSAGTYPITITLGNTPIVLNLYFE